MQKQREKERQREGIDDTWADRFVTDGARRLPQSHPQQQQLPPPPYASGGVMERSVTGSLLNCGMFCLNVADCSFLM